MSKAVVVHDHLLSSPRQWFPNNCNCSKYQYFRRNFSSSEYAFDQELNKDSKFSAVKHVNSLFFHDENNFTKKGHGLFLHVLNAISLFLIKLFFDMLPAVLHYSLP